MAAGSKGIRAGRAYIEIGDDDAELAKGLKRAANRLRAFGQTVSAIGSSLMRIGAMALAPLIGAAKIFMSLGDTVAKMAKRTGISVEALSELRYVASQTGTQIEGLETGIKRMQRTIYDAGRGLSTATAALGDLGLTVQALEGLKPEVQFKLLAERLSQVADPTRKAALALTLFGRSGTEMLPMFEQGERGIVALQERARELGLTMSGEAAAAAEKLTDRFDDVTKVAKQAAFEVGATLAPALHEAFDWLISAMQGARAWIKEHKGMIVTALKISAVVLGIGVALKGLGKISIAAAAAMKFAFGHPILFAIGAVGTAIYELVHSMEGYCSQAERAARITRELRNEIQFMGLAQLRSAESDLAFQWAQAFKEMEKYKRELVDLRRASTRATALTEDYYGHKIAGAEDRLTAATKKFEELNATLKELRAREVTLSKEMGGPATLPEYTMGKDIAARSREAARTLQMQVTGAFSPHALRGMFAPDAQSRTAKATEETAKNTRRIVETMGRGMGLVFE